jgi:plasmid stabilization system protein ParE
MARKVKLSKKASAKLENIITYLETEWSEKVRDEFIKKLDNALEHLSQFPASHPKSDTIKGLHRYVISKQITIFYKFTRGTVFIVTLFDNRQNPDSIKSEIQ